MTLWGVFLQASRPKVTRLTRLLRGRKLSLMQIRSHRKISLTQIRSHRKLSLTQILTRRNANSVARRLYCCSPLFRTVFFLSPMVSPPFVVDTASYSYRIQDPIVVAVVAAPEGQWGERTVQIEPAEASAEPNKGAHRGNPNNLNNQTKQ